MSLKWSDEPPGVGEFIELRRLAGLNPRNATAAAAGLKGGLHSVCGRERGRLVAFGRLVGDGGMVAHLCDVMVEPAWRGSGVRGEVMERLMAWCEANLPEGSCVNVIPDPGSFDLYRRSGFEIRTGMTRYL